MALEVTDWNLLPNQRFFVRMEDKTGTIDIDIFNTKADLDAFVSRVGFATGLPYGTNIFATITADTTEPSSGDALSRFNPDQTFDLKYTGLFGDSLKKFQIGPFTDLPPVEDALLVTEAMVQARAILEINRGTHSSFNRELRLDKHYEALEEGDIISLSSTKRGLVSEPNRIDTLSIEVAIGEDGELNMFDVIDVTVFEDVVR